ncbi:hypothetical protein [Pseudoalteromonas spongiae]|uniref:Uncharacterized protein n=1 Tax=Pseudoalteromonas spongiae TaxID=298657 RepID=A0ABU8ER69_9GAMM
MKTKMFKTKEQLKLWAKKTTGVVLTSIALVNSVQSIEFQFPTPKVLSQVMERDPSNFPDGQYEVNYSNSDDLNLDDLDYSKMAMVIALEAQLANSPSRIGGLRPLLDHLADYTYCCTINRTDPAYVVASFWVLEPSNPTELDSLKCILQKYSTFYAFNDGSGYVTLNNARMGNGTSHYPEI